MTGGSRRFHHKSRNGCGQCKKRHIKCDLQAPICANCSKKDLPCEYLDLQYHSEWQHHQPGQPQSQSQQPHQPHQPYPQQPQIIHQSSFRTTTPATTSSSSNTGSSSLNTIQTQPSQTASRKRRGRQGQQGDYSVLTFRVDGATPSNTTCTTITRPAPVKQEQQPRRRDATLISKNNRSPLDLRQLRVPGSDKLVSHWNMLTAPTFAITETGTELNSKLWDFRPLVKENHYIRSVTRCIASLHINALRAGSTPPAFGSTSPDSIQWTRDESSSSSSRNRLTYAGAIISHSAEAPEIFEAYQQLAIALSTFRAQVTKLDHSNWVNCGTFAVTVLVFRLDHARRAPPGDLQAILIDPLRALRTTTTMGDQCVAFLSRSHLASLGELRRQQEMQMRAQQTNLDNSPSQLRETLIWMDRLLHRVEVEVEQEAILPSFDIPSPRPEGQNISSSSDINHDETVPSGANNGGTHQQQHPLPMDGRLRAAAALRAWTEAIVGQPRAWTHLISSMSWTYHISEEFISLVLRGDPAALVITLYWLVIMNRIVDRWYLDGWARKAGMAILDRIGPDWEDLVAWPITEMKLPTSGGRVVSIAGSSVGDGNSPANSTGSRGSDGSDGSRSGDVYS